MTLAPIGFHGFGSITPHLPVLRRIQPRAMTWVDPGADGLARLREACPRTKILVRLYQPDEVVQARIMQNPASAAAWADALIRGHSAVRVKGLVDWWIIENEVCVFWDQIERFEAYIYRRQELADSDYRCGLYATPNGHFDLPEHDRMAFWRVAGRRTLGMAERRGDVICHHGYGWPTLWGPAEKGGADWNLHRSEKQEIPRIPFPRLKWFISEWGWDRMAAWLNSDQRPGGVLATGLTPARAAQQIFDTGQYLVANYGDRVVGWTMYCLGRNGDPKWFSYDVTGDVIEQYARLVETWRAGLAPAKPVTATKPQVVAYSQRDPRWAVQVLGSGPDTLSQSGCVVSAVAGVLASWGANTDPGRLNAWLREHSGFAGMLYRWDAVRPFGVVLEELITCTLTPAPLARLEAALAADRAVLVQVDWAPGGAVQAHWVRLLPGGKIVDPWQPPGRELDLLSRYFAPGWDAARAIFRVAIYRRAS
jgi:hypothetical protein